MAMYGAPTSPPPKQKPKKPRNSYMIDCMYSYTYVWTKRGDQFWFYPTRVELGEISGYRWDGRRWIYYGFEERSIDQVACAPVPTLY